jgi:hypothetical protein
MKTAAEIEEKIGVSRDGAVVEWSEDEVKLRIHDRRGAVSRDRLSDIADLLDVEPESVHACADLRSEPRRGLRSTNINFVLLSVKIF